MGGVGRCGRVRSRPVCSRLSLFHLLTVPQGHSNNKQTDLKAGCHTGVVGPDQLFGG